MPQTKLKLVNTNQTNLTFLSPTYLATTPYTLVIQFMFPPWPPWQGPDDEFSGFIVDKNNCGKGNSQQPPGELQWVHVEVLVHAWSVRQQDGQGSFKQESKVEGPVVKSLIKDWNSPCLADDEISPLDNDDGNKECRLAGVLKDLTISECPLLTIRIHQIIDTDCIPMCPEPYQLWWVKPILSHDHKIRQESRSSLNDSDLSICMWN